MSLVRPDFGPTLPSLLRSRLGIPPVATLVVTGLLAAVAIAVVVTAATAGRDIPGEQFVYRYPPVFNVLYDEDVLHRGQAREGELLRLEGRRGRFAAEVTVSPLELPPFRGNVTRGLLPAFADPYTDRLRAELDGFELRDEGRARVNDAPGYQLGYRGRTAAGRVTGRDVLLVPEDTQTRGAVVLRFRQIATGRGAAPGKAAREWLATARKAFRSFRYGTERG